MSATFPSEIEPYFLSIPIALAGLIVTNFTASGNEHIFSLTKTKIETKSEVEK